MKIGSQKGVTIAEIVLVISIFMILATIAIPSFQRHVVNADLKNAARSVATDFFLYKEHAIAESRPYRIKFSIANHNYEIQQPPGTTILTKDLRSFRHDISIDGGSTTETVYNIQPRGTVTNGQIWLVNSRGSTATITINITGKTSVQFNMQ